MWYTLTYLPKLAFAALVAVLLAAAPGGAQALGCGRPLVRSGDSTVEIRFFPFPAEHVRASLLRALPTLAARLTKEKGGVIEAKLDSSLAGSAGSVATASRGTIYTEVAPAVQGGVTGVALRIDTSAVGNYATALADEVACLASLLSLVDPSSNPRGQSSASPPATAGEVSVPAKTGFRVALRERLYSKDLAADTSGEPRLAPVTEPTLEVIEDVAVNGVTVFRKGALVKGKLTEATAAKNLARGGALQLSLESATAVDGQEIPIEGGSLKEQGQYKSGVVQQNVNSAVMMGGLVGGLMAGLMSKGYEALIPAGTAFEARVTQPVKVKVEPEPGKPIASSQTNPATIQQAGAVKSDTPPGLNLTGLWYVKGWGQMRLLQAAGEGELIGRAEGYDVDGVVGESHSVLHYSYAGKVSYSMDVTPRGDGNTLAGVYVSGQMRPGAKTYSFEMSRVLSASLPIGTVNSGSSSGPNVGGTWFSRDWGMVKLAQAAGQRLVIGKAEAYEVDGFVSGTTVILNFASQGTVKYSAELTAKGDDTLSGRYATGQLLGDSQTKPTEMSKAPKATQPAGAGNIDSSHDLNVDGTWSSTDWGTIKLTQSAGQQKVTGKARRWDVDGFVNGTHLILYFASRGTVYYSADLSLNGDGTLSGQYASGQMSGNSKTKPIKMTRQK